MVLAATELDDADLVVTAVGADRRGDLGAGDDRRADRDRLAITQHQHLVEIDRAARLGIQQLDAQRLALHHAVLLTAGDHDCVHVASSVVLLRSVLLERLKPAIHRPT